MTHEIPFIDWINDPRTQDRDKAIAHLIQRFNRLRAIALAAEPYIALLDAGKGPSDPAYLPQRDAYRNAVADLEPGDLDPFAPIDPDVHWVTVKLPRRVWEWWAETSSVDDTEEEIRQYLIATYTQDVEVEPR